MSSSNLAIRLTAEPLRTLAFGSISGTYAGIGTALANPSRIFWLQNLTDVSVLISLDGVNDHIYLVSGEVFILDNTSNKANVGGALSFAQGTRFYAKDDGSAPSSGQVTISTFYGTGVDV